MSLKSCGRHSWELYAKCDLTRERYNFFFSPAEDVIGMFLFNMNKEEYALEHMKLICSDHLKLLLIFTPRSLYDEAPLISIPFVVYVVCLITKSRGVHI